MFKLKIVKVTTPKSKQPKEPKPAKQPVNIWKLLFLITFAVVLLMIGGNYLSKTKSIARFIDKTKATIQLWTGSNNSPKNPVTFNDQEYHLPQTTYPRGLNLVFMSDQYASWDEFNNDADALLSNLKTIAPYKTYTYYNVYKIKPNKTGICYVKTQDERKPVLRCNDTDTNNYLANLTLSDFKLIVLSRQEFQSWANVVRHDNSGIFYSVLKALTDPSEQRVNSLLLAHLLGHAFGLKDEEIYVIAKAGGAPHTPDGPNCAPDKATAEMWWGDIADPKQGIGYFEGCAGNDKYIKPTESSIMNLNTGSPVVYSYGPVSERYLKKILDYCYLDTPKVYSDDPTFFDQYPDFKTCIRQ